MIDLEKGGEVNISGERAVKSWSYSKEKKAFSPQNQGRQNVTVTGDPSKVTLPYT